MEITKEGAQSLRLKMPNVELCLKEATVILRLLPACSKIARTNLSVVKSRLLTLVQLRTREQAFQLITRRLNDDMELLKFNSLR